MQLVLLAFQRSKKSLYARKFAFAFHHQRHEHVPAVDAFVSHPACFFERDLNDHLDAGGRNDLLDDDPLSASDHCRDGVAHSVDVHPQLSQHHWGRALGEAQQPQQQMLGSDVGMVRALGFFLGKCQRLLSVRREPLERIHGCGPSVPDGAVKNTCL